MPFDVLKGYPNPCDFSKGYPDPCDVLKGSSDPCDVLKGYLDPCDEHGFVLGGGFSQEQGAKTVSGIEPLSTTG